MNNHPFPSSTAHFILAAASLRWLAGVILAIAATLALAAEPPRKVLVLYSDNRLLPGLAVIDETLDSVLRAEYGPEIELSTNFLIWTDHGQRLMRTISLRSCARSTQGRRSMRSWPSAVRRSNFCCSDGISFFPAFRSCT